MIIIDSRKQIVIFGIVFVILILLGFMLLFFSEKQEENSEFRVAPASASERKNVNGNGMSIATSSKEHNDLILNKNIMPIVKIETNKGEITLELFVDDAPKTVENFLSLVKKGFYDKVIFHRVINGFMIQGGDPTGTGMGGPGYKFADELNPATPSYKAGYARGTLAMANSGQNTNGSQFFIMHKDYPLPHNYTIFGRVISGMETVDAIASSKTDSSDRPLEDIAMERVKVIE
jgi:cyclophilin family peptidyl-prolyl cis-trans isomerase